jgi:hypothetical protein
MAAMLSLQVLSPNTVQAAESAKGEDLAPFRKCTVSENKNCILSIKAKLPNGKIIEANTTGRFENVSWTWGKHSRVIGPLDEWELEGVVFENGSGKFTINTFHFPDGLTFCWPNDVCNSRVEQINFYANPSNLDRYKTPIQLVGNASKLTCPSDPNNCKLNVAWSFASDIEFTVSYALGAQFNPAVTLGRVKGIKVETIPNLDLLPKIMKQVDVTFTPIKMGHLLYNQPDIYALDTATHEDDQPAIWIHSTKHSTTGALGYCGFLGGLSIVSNANGIDLPKWNTTNETIDVNVRAAHFRPDGTPQKGYLEVRIPIEMAKCLWDIDLKGEISGKVSITYADSTTPELLTVTGSVTGNDYLMVSTGYHYSAPTIAIQLKNKETAPTTAPVQNVQEKTVAAPVKNAKKSITCKKGAKVKKLTAIVPKCPTGYKKVV